MYLETISITFQHPTSKTIAIMEVLKVELIIRERLLKNGYELVSDGAGYVLQSKSDKGLITEGVQLSSEQK